MNLIGISPHPRFLVLIKLKFQTSQGKNGNQQMFQDTVSDTFSDDTCTVPL